MFNSKTKLVLLATVVLIGTATMVEVVQSDEGIPPLPEVNPPLEIMQVEEENQDEVLEALVPSEKAVFEGQDISDHAKHVSKTSDQSILSLAKPDDGSFFSVTPYKQLSLYNIHTKEKLDIVFWANGDYIAPAIKRLNWFMRDWRKNKSKDMDPELYSLLHELYEEVDGEKPIHVISGHRTAKTNSSLRKQGRNTAKKSQHIEGRAADIMIPGVAVKKLRTQALELEEGGVGYYPKSGFVHVDTWRVRQW